MTAFYVRSRPTANWATGHVYSSGDKVVSTSSTTGLGVCFEVTTPGTSSGSEPSWNLTVGGTTTDSGGVIWTTRGAAGIWLASKTWALGDRVCRVSQTSLNSASSVVWECTTAGAGGGSEPAWPTTITAGTTTQADSSATWTARACKTWDNANPFMAALLKDTANSTVKVAAGDTIYVGKGHNESTTPSSFNALTWAFPGTAASPNIVLCVDDTGQLVTPTTLATTGAAQVASGASISGFLISGHVYMYGMRITNNCGTGGHMQLPGTSTTIASGLVFDSCALSLGGSGSAVLMQLGSGANVAHNKVTLNNTTMNFTAANQQVVAEGGEIIWKNTPSAISGTVPTGGLFATSSTLSAGTFTVDGVDLSGIGSNKLFNANNYYPGSTSFLLRNCKIAAGTVLNDTPVASNVGYGSANLDFINCDSGGTNYKLHRQWGQGTVDHELTDIKSGGASDGTTGVAWKMVTNANAQFVFPLESFPFAVWNDNSGSSKTATVEILTDSATALNNDDIWLEVEYPADSGDPLGGFVNNAKSNILASNAAQATSTASWTTTGITNVMKQKLQVTFTPQQKGPLTARVKLAKASTTVYVDPVLSIS